MTGNEADILVLSSPAVNKFFTERHDKPFLNFLVGLETENCLRAEYILPFLSSEPSNLLQPYFFDTFMRHVGSTLPGGLRFIGVVAKNSFDKDDVEMLLHLLEKIHPEKRLTSTNLMKVVVNKPNDVQVTIANGRKVSLGEGFNAKTSTIKNFNKSVGAFAIDTETVFPTGDLVTIMNALADYEFVVNDDNTKVFVTRGKSHFSRNDQCLEFAIRILVHEYPMMDNEFRQSSIREALGRALCVTKDYSPCYIATNETSYLPTLVLHNLHPQDGINIIFEKWTKLGSKNFNGRVEISGIHCNTELIVVQNKGYCLDQLITFSIIAAVVAFASVLTGYLLLAGSA